MTRSRDVYIDAVRAFSVSCIVLGHWLSSKAWSNSGRVGVSNILSLVPDLSMATWLFMTVPAVLFAGGFSNFMVLRQTKGAGQAYGDFYSRRLRRVLRPVLYFVGIWISTEALCHLLSVGGDGLVRGVALGGFGPFGPLWFIGVYIGIIALCPVLIELHGRHRIAVLVSLVAGCAGVDVARFMFHVPLIGWLNLALAWLLPHQLGFFYADGALKLCSRRLAFAIALVGITGLFTLTGTGLYSPSIGGIPGSRDISNMAPPTFMIVMLTCSQVGLILLCRPLALILLSKRRMQALVAKLTAVTMTIYLWHMTALLAAILILAPFGFSYSGRSLANWWLERPIWLAVGAAVLAILTRATAWTEVRSDVERRLPARVPAVQVEGPARRGRDRQVGSGGPRTSGAEQASHSRVGSPWPAHDRLRVPELAGLARYAGIAVRVGRWGARARHVLFAYRSGRSPMPQAALTAEVRGGQREGPGREARWR